MTEIEGLIINSDDLVFPHNVLNVYVAGVMQMLRFTHDNVHECEGYPDGGPMHENSTVRHRTTHELLLGHALTHRVYHYGKTVWHELVLVVPNDANSEIYVEATAR